MIKTPYDYHYTPFSIKRYLFTFSIIGYNPIILFGGATGLIGDPSGRSTERK
jgi:tyrosyl-tRNA synthetase